MGLTYVAYFEACIALSPTHANARTHTHTHITTLHTCKLNSPCNN